MCVHAGFSLVLYSLLSLFSVHVNFLWWKVLFSTCGSFSCTSFIASRICELFLIGPGSISAADTLSFITSVADFLLFSISCGSSLLSMLWWRMSC